MHDIAIAHKDYAVRGGGEYLAEELARTFDAPLYVGGKHGGVDLEYDDVRLVDATAKQRWMIRRGGIARSIGYMVAWQNEDRLLDYETIITSGNEPLWYVPKPDQTLIAYCHSPPRNLYDLNHSTGDGTIGALFRAAQRALFHQNAAKPDVWVANGEAVARRINLYWDVPYTDIHVVYPPVDVTNLRPRNAPTEDYYLYLGRLAHHKRIGIAVEACNELGVPLVVAGRGPQRENLEAIAGDTVDVVGYVSEERKRELFAGAKAMLMPAQQEDFGIAPVEALASGTPVIGVDEGMTRHQIVDGKNGVVADATADGFQSAIRSFELGGVEWDDLKIREWAVERFSVDAFRNGMRAVVESTDERIESTMPTP